MNMMFDVGNSSNFGIYCATDANVGNSYTIDGEIGVNYAKETNSNKNHITFLLP